MDQRNGSPDSELARRVAAAGISLRELGRRTGMSWGTLLRTFNGERELTTGEAQLVALALGDAASPESDEPPPVAPVTAPAATVISLRARRAYVCERCRSRRFLPSADAPIPECCGRPMVRQPNAPYMGLPSAA